MIPKLTARERMWRVARCLPVFSVEDLQVIGTSKPAEASAFVKCLARRKYVMREASEIRPRRGRPLAKYRLLKNYGPQLPSELRGHNREEA